jgi:hypothetical protein
LVVSLASRHQLWQLQVEVKGCHHWNLHLP